MHGDDAGVHAGGPSCIQHHQILRLSAHADAWYGVLSTVEVEGLGELVPLYPL